MTGTSHGTMSPKEITDENKNNIDQKLHSSKGSLWFAERAGNGADRVKAPKKYLTPDTEVRGLRNADGSRGMYDPRHTVSVHMKSKLFTVQ
jgi:hypothetical protein